MEIKKFYVLELSIAVPSLCFMIPRQDFDNILMINKQHSHKQG